MEDMSTKPDESTLFAMETKPGKPSSSGFSDEPSTVARLGSISPAISEPFISDEDPTLSVPKLLDPSSTELMTFTSTDESTDALAPVPDPPAKNPDLTLYFLQYSRSIRIAWLLEELGLEYNLVSFEREEDGSAPEAYKAASGGSMGKAPVLRDGEVILQESGAITQYLLGKYDPLHHLLPSNRKLRAKALTYIHAAEGTFMLHGLLPYYAERADPEISGAMLTELASDIGRDLDWLDTQIKEDGMRYLVADTVTAADTMMAYGIQYLIEYELHPAENEGRWANIHKWLKNIEKSVCYQRAIAKTGQQMG